MLLLHDAARVVAVDRLYRKLFRGWFALTLGVTVVCLGGNRALPEMLLAVLLLLMSGLWSIRVSLAGGFQNFGPRTPHLIAIAFFIWTAMSIVPIPVGIIADLSPFSAWGQALNREVDEATNLSLLPTSATMSIDPASSRRDLRRLGCYYLFFLLSTAHMSRWRDLRWMLNVVVFIAVGEALVGGAGILSNSRHYLFVLPNPIGMDHRLFGTFVNPNHAGTLLGVGLMLWMLWALLPAAIRRRTATRSRAHGTRGRGIVSALSGATLITGLILTNSHGALLAAGLPCIVFITVCVIRFPHTRTPLVYFAAVALVVGFVATRLLPESEHRVQARKMTDRWQWLSGEHPLLRQNIWEGAFAAGAVSPLIGSGPGTIIDAYRPFDVTHKETLINSAHNTYLNVLVERGLVGVTLAALGIGWWICAIRPRSRRAAGLSRHRSARHLSGLKSQRCADPADSGRRSTRVRAMIRMGLGGAAAVVLLQAVVDFPLQIPAIALVFVTLITAVLRTSPHWRPMRREDRRRLLVPLATALAGMVLVVSHVRPLEAAMQLGKTVQLRRMIESQLADGQRVNAKVRSRLVNFASRLHPLRAYDARGAAYGLTTRRLSLSEFRANREKSERLFHDAVEMIRTNPFCVEARLAAANAAAHLGNVGAAVILSRQAQRLDAGHAETHYAAGRALMTAGAEPQALIAYVRSLNTSPRFVYDIARSVGERNLQEKILRLRIDDPRSLCWLAMSLRGGDNDSRMHVVERLHAMLDDPRQGLSRAERLYLRGQSALWLEDRAEEAISSFKQSLAIEPLIWIRWHLAQAYRRAHRPVEAQGQLDIISRLDANYVPYENRLQQIETHGLEQMREPE